MKKGCYKRWWFWALIAYFTLGFFSLSSTEVGNGSVFLILIITLIIPIIMYVLFTWSFKKIISFLLSDKKKNQKEKENQKELGILAQVSVHHIEGLSIAGKTFCELTLTLEKLNIVGGGTNFSIAISQLRTAEIKTEKKIANIVHSSAVKGIVGGLVFGPIGLVVGSRATSKEKRIYTHYLILNYINSTGELAAIMFEVDDEDEFKALNIVDKIMPLIINNTATTVQL